MFGSPTLPCSHMAPKWSLGMWRAGVVEQCMGVGNQRKGKHSPFSAWVRPVVWVPLRQRAFSFFIQVEAPSSLVCPLQLHCCGSCLWTCCCCYPRNAMPASSQKDKDYTLPFQPFSLLFLLLPKSSPTKPQQGVAQVPTAPPSDHPFAPWKVALAAPLHHFPPWNLPRLPPNSQNICFSNSSLFLTFEPGDGCILAS